MKPTDPQISIEKINAGDTLEFRKVYELCIGKIVIHCWNILGDMQKAEDAAAHAMIQLWVKRTTIENWPNLERFLFMVARRRCIDILRQDKRLRQRHQAIDPPSGSYDPDIELAEVLDELCKLVLMSPGILTEEQIALLFMRIYKGLPFKTIAEKMQIPTSTVHYRWLAIVEILKKLARERDMLLLLAFLTSIETCL